MNAQLNTYAEDNKCPRCGDKKEVIYQQYIDYFTCQNCGASFETDGTILESMESQYEH